MKNINKTIYTFERCVEEIENKIKLNEESFIDLYKNNKIIKYIDNIGNNKNFITKHYLIVRDIIKFNFNKSFTINNNTFVKYLIYLLKDFRELKVAFNNLDPETFDDSINPHTKEIIITERTVISGNICKFIQKHKQINRNDCYFVLEDFVVLIKKVSLFLDSLLVYTKRAQFGIKYYSDKKPIFNTIKFL